MESNVNIYLRIRPLFSEKHEKSFDLNIKNDQINIVKKSSHTSKSFAFDKIFNETAKQVDLYQAIIKPLVPEILNGYNCTVLAYGQTGTGKTHTIEGNFLDNEAWNKDNNAGLVPRTFLHLLESVNKNDTVKVSLIEIYNEDIFDLLSDSSEKIQIYENENKNTVFNNLFEVRIKTKQDINSILHKAYSKRQTASTLMNKRSSRSHIIFSISVCKKIVVANQPVYEKIGKMNLVDLAGSECIKRTGCKSEIRVREACNINQSLLALCRVINSLAEKNSYIPFRSSNLTRILKESLGGNSKTTLIATLSPSMEDFEDSLSTLEFSQNVKLIKNKITENIFFVAKNDVNNLKSEISELKKRIEQLENDRIKIEKEKLDLEKENIVLEKEKDVLEEKLDIFENKCEDITKEMEQLEKENKKLKSLTNHQNVKKNKLGLRNQDDLSKKIDDKNNYDIQSIDKKKIDNLIKEIKKNFNASIKTLTNIKKDINTLIDSILEDRKDNEISHYNQTNTKLREVDEIIHFSKNFYLMTINLEFEAFEDLIENSKSLSETEKTTFISELDGMSEEIRSKFYSVVLDEMKENFDAYFSQIKNQEKIINIKNEVDSKLFKTIKEIDGDLKSFLTEINKLKKYTKKLDDFKLDKENKKK